MIDVTLVRDIGIQGRSGESVKIEEKETLKVSTFSRLAGDENDDDDERGRGGQIEASGSSLFRRESVVYWYSF